MEHQLYIFLNLKTHDILLKKSIVSNPVSKGEHLSIPLYIRRVVFVRPNIITLTGINRYLFFISSVYKSIVHLYSGNK